MYSDTGTQASTVHVAMWNRVKGELLVAGIEVRTQSFNESELLGSVMNLFCKLNLRVSSKFYFSSSPYNSNYEVSTVHTVE